MNALTTPWNPWNWFRNDRTPAQQRGNRSSRGGSEMMPFSYFGPLSSFYRDMDQMFGNAFGSFGLIPQAMRGMVAETFNPKVNVAATDKEYIMTVEAPGISEKDIKIDMLDDGLLRIRGEKRQDYTDKEHALHQVESSYGFFERILPLPPDAERDDVSASFENGLVTITLPRKESAQPQSRSIPINGASQSGRDRFSGSSGERSSEANRVSGASESHRSGASAGGQRKTAA